MGTGRCRSAAVCLALCVGSGVAARAQSPPAPAEVEASLTIEGIDEAHEEQARFFGEFFQGVDRIFGEQYLEDRERKIQVRAGGETTFNDEGTSIDTAVRLGLRVPLPSLERRLNLYLEIGEDISKLGDASRPNFDEGDRRLSIGASLLGRYRDNVEAGFKVNLLTDDRSFLSAYPFVRYELLRKPLRYYFEQRLIWESDGSWRTRTDCDVDRTLNPNFFLRFRNRVDYVFGDHGAQAEHGLILRQSVFHRSGLSYELWLEYYTAGNDPETFDDDTIAYAQVRWRGRVWRDWLEYELRPVYTMPLERGRDHFFSFLVSLTVIWDSYLGGAANTTTDMHW